jgi:hypothetical protein
VKASRLRLEKTVDRFLRPGPWQAVPIETTLAELEPLAETIEAYIVEKTLPLLLSVANLENSQVALAEFRKLWAGSGYGIASESDQELLHFQKQLRTVWETAEQISLGRSSSRTKESGLILKEWFSRPFSDQEAWWVEPAAGKIVALPANFRAIAGRVLIYNQQRLARCSNRACRARFFLKRRKDQIFCLEEGCLQHGNRKRNTKTRARKAKLSPGIVSNRKRRP